MNIKKLLMQVFLAVLLFIIISSVIEGDFSQEMIVLKTRNGLVFGVLYGIYLVVREKFIKK